MLKRSSSVRYQTARRSLGLVAMALAIASLGGCGEIAEETSGGAGTSSLPPGASGPNTGTTDEQATAPTVVSQEAAVGVGARGQGNYGNDPITLPAKTYWKAQEKIAFEIQIPHALDLYKGLDPNGRGPASHEAFMRDVIEANRIPLPELPEGSQYRYDPQTETLFVDSLQ